LLFFEEYRMPTVLRMEESRPDDLEALLDEAPIAYVPLGTYEHHGWHLPVCFDGIKSHALSLRAAERTGGVVLPTFYYGTGGGHLGYKWTVIVEEERIRPLLAETLDSLAQFGFRVVVLFTGHYAGEQVRMVHALAAEAAERHPQTRFIGLTEPEFTTPAPGDTSRGDHAAKYETSIALALNPDWVRLDRLTPGREAVRVTLPQTPRLEGRQYEPNDPLYAIWGQDPAVHATAELGQRIVEEVTGKLAEKVLTALAEVR
jgi:creatinine amidohydrolase